MSDYPMLISNKLHSFRNFGMQIYVYITFDGIKKFTVAVFLENFLFNKDKPSCQNQPLDDGGAAHCPPNGVHSQTHFYQ